MAPLKSKKEQEPAAPSQPAAERDVVEVILRWIAIVVGVCCLLLIIWLYRPWIGDWVTPDPTATPVLPTSTPMDTPTPAPTWTPVPSITPTPSPIPLPTSIYKFSEMETLEPAPPGYVNEPIILNENNAIVSPELSNPLWIPSSQIAVQLGGADFTEPYHATFSEGSITWPMDVALPAGYYELFVLDTHYSSGGSLVYQVKNGENVMTSLTGTQKVTFRSSQGNTAQSGDQWHSIGVFQLPEANLLSVSTQWPARNEYTIVAIDRILISHLPDNTGSLLETLPQGIARNILDDKAAKIKTDTFPVDVTENRSWGSQSTILINPGYDDKVTWQYQDLLPLGTYEVVVFIPKLNGNAEVTYQLYANDQPLTSAQGEGPISVMQSEYQDGWYSLGDWEIPPYFTYPVELRLEMGIKQGTLGEVAVDAVAFILKSMPEILGEQ
jgi:hypothetical protein